MKKLIFFFAILITGTVVAQDFEGTIRWKFDMKMDPAMQAQMQQSLQMMQQQMNDPQMKAMMESNPQFKAQMEAMQKAASSGSIAPDEMVVQVKGQDALTKIVGGVMEMEVLTKGAENKSYMLDRAAKTYIVADDSNDEDDNLKVTKTSETRDILGYKTTKYIVENPGDNSRQVIWATSQIKLKSLNTKVGSQSSLFYKDIDGLPLRMEVSAEGTNVVIEATEVKRGSLDATLFRVPAGYTETKAMNGMMGR